MISLISMSTYWWATLDEWSQSVPVPPEFLRSFNCHLTVIGPTARTLQRRVQ